MECKKGISVEVMKKMSQKSRDEKRLKEEKKKEGKEIQEMLDEMLDANLDTQLSDNSAVEIRESGMSFQSLIETNIYLFHLFRWWW